MSLIPIVRALGGELFDRGRRAVVPGPGHSRHDRSVSLLISGDRLIVHSFGRSTWREVLEDLRSRGLIDIADRPTTRLPQGEGALTALRLDGFERVAVARRIWSEASPLGRQLSIRHVRLRHVDRSPPVSEALRHHVALPLAVYAGRGVERPALLAAVTDTAGELCAVEITYLDPSGRRACGLAVPRKIIGVLPPACAVRLDVAGPELLVGEGVFTTLSASTRFALPGWALLSTRNLRGWTPPEGVRRVLIAADRGCDGERSARYLRRRLNLGGVPASIAWPPLPSEDWSAWAEYARSGDGGEKGARADVDARDDRMVREPVLDTPP